MKPTVNNFICISSDLCPSYKCSMSLLKQRWLTCAYMCDQSTTLSCSLTIVRTQTGNSKATALTGKGQTNVTSDTDSST